MNIHGIINVRNVKGIVLFLVLLLGIVFGAFFLNQRGGFELRKKASEIKGSQLRFKGPSEINVVKVGETFTVDLVLDTTTDSQYTISGVDAVVSYSFQNSPAPAPSCVPRACAQFVPPADFCKDGKIVMKAPQSPCDCPPPPTCIKTDQTGGANGITYEENLRVIDNFQFPGGGLRLMSVTPGKIFDSYPTYPKNNPQPIPLPKPVPCGGFQGLLCPSGNVCIYDNGTKSPPPNESDSMGKCVSQGQGGDGITEEAVCPPFPGCFPPGSGAPWNVCWGDYARRCTSTTNISPVTISGIKNYSVNEKGYFKGFSGQGVFATATFIAQSPGKATFSLVYKGSSATDDTNVNGFLANQPVSLQKPQERLLTAPQAFTVEVVVSQPTPTPTPANQCVGKPDGSTCVLHAADCPICPPGPTTCMKRPCVEQQLGICRNQKCEPPVISVTPTPSVRKFRINFPNNGEVFTQGKQFPIRWEGGYPTVTDPSRSVSLMLTRDDGITQVGWISFGNPTSGEYLWDPAKVRSAIGFGYNVDVAPGIYKIRASDYNDPAGTAQAYDVTDMSIRIVSSGGTPTPTPPVGCRYETVECFAAPCEPVLVCPTSTPTPSPKPEPRVMINFRLALEGRKNHATVVDIYGMTTNMILPNQKILDLLGAPAGGPGDPLRPPGNRLDKLGTVSTSPSGTGTLSLDRTYAGTTYLLFAQTMSHLRKAAQNYQAIQLYVGPNPACRSEICTMDIKFVDFGTLIAGDVYADEKGYKDNLINTFDVGAVFAAWSGADVVAKPRDTSTFGGILPREIGPAADLNGDGVVNNRDLAMLLVNFNKRGDTLQ